MQIIKRDGTKVSFDKQKIINAINGSILEVYGTIENDIGTAEDIADIIETYAKARELADKKPLTVEDIQDTVEDLLMDSEYKEVARAYVRFRYKKEIAREVQSTFFDAIGEKLEARNVQNQNANVDEHSFGGRIGEASGVMTKQYALDNIVSNMAKANHLNNEIYIHDLDSYAVGMHNCCARETKFCTVDHGVKSFLDYEDGDKIRVLTPYFAQIKDATVHKYGIQKLNKITFSLAGQRFVTERFTSNHRWILEDRTETTNLKVGDRLLKAPVNFRHFNWDNATEKQKYYWCLGFVLADGTEAYRWSHGKKCEDVKFVRMRLCGDKVKYEPRFESLKHSTKEMSNGDLYLTFSSTIGFRKAFPNLDEMTIFEKIALFDGLYCADGQHIGSRKSILTTDEQIASFIEDDAPSFGWYILNIEDKTGEVTNYGTRGFAKEYTFIGDSNKYYWTVVDIQEDCEEEVWCLDVEDAHAFILPNGIVTGNCLSIPFDDLLAKGFNTRQTDVRPANSVNTAFQLVAVIFQLQSLQQFGGVSATHLDWTMVPYVRKSFTKHMLDGMKYCENKSEYKLKRFLTWLKYEGDGTLHFDNEEFKELHPEAWQYAMDMTVKETYQAVEGMYHNLNTLQSRSGNQLPFTSINYGTCTLPEGRLIIKALLDVSIGGIGKLHMTSIFPCSIMVMKNGINRKPGDPNYDLYQLALQSTAKRLYPNYANGDLSTQKEWVDFDRKSKEEIINNLSVEDYNKLIKRLEENPELKQLLMLEVYEDEMD